MAEKKSRRGRPKSKERSLPIQARVKQSLYDELTAVAEQMERSRSYVLVKALVFWLKHHRKPPNGNGGGAPH